MSGLLDNIPMINHARDKAWEAMTKRKDARNLMLKDFNFPLDGSYYVWCLAWEKAWEAGFEAGWEAREEQEESKK